MHVHLRMLNYTKFLFCKMLLPFKQLDKRVNWSLFRHWSVHCTKLLIPAIKEYLLFSSRIFLLRLIFINRNFLSAIFKLIYFLFNPRNNQQSSFTCVSCWGLLIKVPNYFLGVPWRRLSTQFTCCKNKPIWASFQCQMYFTGEGNRMASLNKRL